MPHYKNVSNVTGGGTIQPPYIFDDPRWIFDEKCLYYDGDFDLKCLVTLVRKPGGGKWPDKVYPQVDIINLIFKTCVDYVNDKKYEEDDTCEIKRYQFPSKVPNITIRTTDMNVKRRLFKITSDEFNVNTISRFLDKDNNPTSIVSSSLTKLSAYVSSSLHFNKPQKIKVNAGIIKVNDYSKEPKK